MILGGGLKATEVEIQIDPKNPIKGEPFKVIFKVDTDDNNEPYISFNPGGTEVLGKKNHGLSVRTTIINGKVSTKREAAISYELVSERAGNIKLSNIKVNIGKKLLSFKDLNIRVLAKGAKPKSFFVTAIPSKFTAYIGEGIDVDYYLYYNVPIVAHEIAEFPKLNNFIKRFHVPNERSETVDFNGIVYQRSKKYSARVYPEKTGKLIIDPLRLKVQYSSRNRNRPFSGFGFSLGQYMVKTTSSAKVEINVLPLPAENIPKNFLGLIGEHDFSLKVQRQKYLVNEAIELKLEVTGPGALENLDAPKLLSNPNLETFDTKGDMNEIGNSNARKLFEYTYLARGPLKMPETKIEFSFFDPNSKTYIAKSIVIPAITVSGAQIASRQQTEMGKETKNSDSVALSNLSIKKGSVGLLAPVFDPGIVSVYWKSIVNIVLVCGIMLFLISMVLGREKRDKNEKELIKLCTNIKKVGAHYSLAFKLINYINPDNKEPSLSKIIERSDLSDKAKRYFIDFIDLSEGSSYGHDAHLTNFDYKNEYFKELQSLAKKMNAKTMSIT